MKQTLLVIVSALVLAGCAAQVDVGPRDIPVESFELLDVKDANARATAAAAAGELWPLDALSVAERFVEWGGGRYVSIEKVDEPSESPKATTITIIRGGYLDDSIWGHWNQLFLSRQSDDTWRIDEARRAWRCYRAHQTDSFGERRCL